jgi:hypothetical protein
MDNSVSQPLADVASTTTEEEEVDVYDLTSPVSAFLERSRKQVERYFRRLTQPEPTHKGKEIGG